MPTTVADVMVATLKASGVRRVYGLPGDSINGFTDALRRDGEVVWEHVRHEEAAAFAAAGDAAMTGQLAVCAASCGPGNLHLINGLFDANRTRVPVLAIAAHIPREEIGGSYFQETHPQELFRECSVYAELVSVPEQLPRVLEIAMRHAIERGGVAVVVVPGEVFPHYVKHDIRPAVIAPAASVIRPSDDALAAAAESLNAAERVTILAGAGCRGAHDELVALARTLKAPVVHTLRGKEFAEYDNPYDVGMTGLLGFASGYRAMEHCDVLLMLGTDFPYRPFYPENARVIQVDVRGEHIGRRIHVDHGLVGTVRDTIAALLPRLDNGGRDATHLARMQSHYRRTRERLDALAKTHGSHGPIHPQVTAVAVDRVAADDAVFLADVGTPTLWAARYLRLNGRRRLLGSSRRDRHLRDGPRQPQLRRSRPRRRTARRAGRGPRRARQRPARGLRARRAGGHRGHDQPSGALDPAQAHRGAGPGLHPLGHSQHPPPAEAMRSSRSPRPTSASWRSNDRHGRRAPARTRSERSPCGTSWARPPALLSIAFWEEASRICPATRAWTPFQTLRSFAPAYGRRSMLDSRA